MYNFIKFQAVKYKCRNGMKFSGNFSQIETEAATCNASANEFQDLTETCVHSEIEAFFLLAKRF